jgi:hypothetical protein
VRLSGARARAWGLGSVVALVAAAWPGRANGAPFELAWSAPAGCPSREEIVEATRARLGESPSEAPPELFVQGTVRPGPGGFVVTLALEDASGHALGERDVRVEEQSCKAVKKPASLVLAMMIAVARPHVEEQGDAGTRPRVEEQGEAVAQPRPGSSQEQPETPPASVGAVNPPAPPAPHALAPLPSAVPHPPRLLIGAGGVASLGVLPTAGVGFALRGMVAPGSTLLVGLEASFEAGGSVRVGGGEVGFQLFSASTRVGLPVLRTTRFELIPTLGARGALLRTSPTGFTVVKDEVRTTMLAGPGVLVRVRLGPHLFAEALPEIEAVLVRDRLRTLDVDKLYHVHRAGPFDARLSLGVGYEFR